MLITCISSFPTTFPETFQLRFIKTEDISWMRVQFVTEWTQYTLKGFDKNSQFNKKKIKLKR